MCGTLTPQPMPSWREEGLLYVVCYVYSYGLYANSFYPQGLLKYVDSSWNVMAHGDAREGKWKGNWRMECVASTLHTTSEHGVSSITTADAHTSAASSRLNWHPRWFKWTSPFHRTMKSGFFACAITFQLVSNFYSARSSDTVTSCRMVYGQQNLGGSCLHLWPRKPNNSFRHHFRLVNTAKQIHPVCKPIIISKTIISHPWVSITVTSIIVIVPCT